MASTSFQRIMYDETWGGKRLGKILIHKYGEKETLAIESVDYDNSLYSVIIPTENTLEIVLAKLVASDSNENFLEFHSLPYSKIIRVVKKYSSYSVELRYDGLCLEIHTANSPEPYVIDLSSKDTGMSEHFHYRLNDLKQVTEIINKHVS